MLPPKRGLKFHKIVDLTFGHQFDSPNGAKSIPWRAQGRPQGVFGPPLGHFGRPSGSNLSFRRPPGSHIRPRRTTGTPPGRLQDRFRHPKSPKISENNMDFRVLQPTYAPKELFCTSVSGACLYAARTTANNLQSSDLGSAGLPKGIQFIIYIIETIRSCSATATTCHSHASAALRLSRLPQPPCHRTFLCPPPPPSTATRPQPPASAQPLAQPPATCHCPGLGCLPRGAYY